MAFYRYRAIDADGKIAKGEIDVLNEFDLVAQLKNIGLELIHAQAMKGSGGAISTMARRELINFFFQLEMLLRAGVPILAIFADLRGTAESAAMRNLCGSLYEKIDAGSTLSEAFAANPGVFSELMVNLVRAGEASGQLPEILLEIERSLKRQDELEAKAKQLMLYPAFVTMVITGVVVFLMVFIVPQITKFVVNMGQQVPLPTRLLIWVSELFIHYWWLILPAPVGIFFLLLCLARVSPQTQYLLHILMLRLPYLGPVIKKIILARICDTQGLTYRAGISVLEGLSYCSAVAGNLAIQKAVNRARDRIASGSTISHGFAAQQIFPSLVIRMLRVGEETGDLEGALKNISYFYNRDIEESIARVQAMIEPTLTVIIGLIVGWVMLAVLGPIYDTISKMQM